MCKQFLSKIILVTTIIITIHSNIQAQHHLGIEAGATFSVLYTIPSPQEHLYSDPVIGGRAGLVFESQIKDFFAVKTGIFGALKGCQLPIRERWNLVYITIPALVIFTPIKPLKLGIGVELGALVSNNFPLLVNQKLSVGIRAEIAWQINPSFRLIAHSTVDATPTTSAFHTDAQGSFLAKRNYNNITGGLSLAYTIKTFNKKK